MTPYTAQDGELRYLITAADGSTRPTSVPDIPEARSYLNWSVRAPLAHQVRDFIRFKDGQIVPGVGRVPHFALFYEQRARKTKVALDVFRYNYEKGVLDALFVIGYPSGVPPVWLDEIQKDFPPELLARTKSVHWRSVNPSSKSGKELLFSLRPHPGPIVVAMNCEALARSKKAWDYLEWLLKRRRAMVVADESAWAASWTAQTQKLLTLGRRPSVVIKAILDGTPVSEGPGEIWYPAKFLHPQLLGFADKEAFQARYYEYEEEEIPETRPVVQPCGNCGGLGGNCFICAGTGSVVAQVPTGVVIRNRVKRDRHDPRTGKVVQSFDVFKGYRNCDELEAKLKTFGARVLRSDVSDAPPKSYNSLRFELTPIQRRVYEDLRLRYAAELNGGEVRAANVLLRMTRLQMVARNYYPPEREGVACERCGGEGWLADGECPICDGLGVIVRVTELRRIDPDRNPAVEALIERLRQERGAPAVIWCRFKQDVRDVLVATSALGLRYFRYDGDVPEREREGSYQAFRRGDGDGIVATVGSGLQRGKDCSRAGLLLYFSNDFSLRKRQQSEDRAESLDRLVPTDVVDLIAVGTRDEEVIGALRAKRSLAELIMGDKPQKWL